MANVKRLIRCSIDWKKLAERVPEEQKPNFMAFKSISDKYFRAMVKNPENPPCIDWDDYDKQIDHPDMVEKFERLYEGMDIPYPPNPTKAQFDEQEKIIKAENAEFKKQSDLQIAKHQKQIDYLKSLIPFDQMTMEDFKDSYPELAIDPLNKPTFWPHNDEEQIDYRDKGHPLYGTSPHGGH